MGMKVDDLVRQIRTEANQTARSSDDLMATAGAPAELEKLRAAAVTARRAQDQLPPIRTYRSGFVARLELWVKLRLKRATRWFTWEQANFNAATVTSIESTERLLTSLKRELSELRSSAHGGEDSAEPARLSAAVNARLAALESNVQALLTEVQSELAEQSRRIDLLTEEHRVCFRQLALEISETAIVSDRAKRNLEMQITELSRRLEEMKIEKAAGQGR